MEKAGLLESEWEDPAVSALEGRPRRRFYSVTAVGEAALTNAGASAVATNQAHRGLAPS
jgi:DNA-binding PadR family transcriptional regulator